MADRPVQIEITQEMIEAGEFACDRLISASWPERPSTYLLALEVYKAMHKARASLAPSSPTLRRD